MLNKRLPALPEATPDHKKPRRVYYPLNPLRTLLFGHPMETEHQEHARLPKFLALAIFSSDAISSVAYATQQILLAFGAAGLAAVSLSGEPNPLYSRLTLGVSAAIIFLLVVVVTSYWQTIFGYPKGGGSYIVSKSNLGATAGLIAGAAMLIDYVLTVAVSIASGVQNMLATPALQHWLHLDPQAPDYASRYPHYLVAFCVFFIVMLTLASLRGLKESGMIFAFPTYFFIAMASLMIVLGAIGPYLGWHIYREAVNQTIPPEAMNAIPATARVAMIFLVLKAFANGCSAMTGIEAVSDGIPAFRAPQSRNAAYTLLMLAGILAFLFCGISWIATQLHVVYWEHGNTAAPPVIDQLSAAIFGKDAGPLRSGLYYCMQFSTTAILILAANTSYADFPRLSSIIANDRYMPKPLANLGDKLVFSNGIILLGTFSCVLIVLFHGSVDQLIPLYAVGVFTAFTLSQSGMVMRWLRGDNPTRHIRACVNGTGAFFTFIVLLNILWEKRPEEWTVTGFPLAFAHSSWIVVLIGALLFSMFKAIHHHYEQLDKQLSLESVTEAPPRISNTVLVLVPSMHKGLLNALAYARSVSSDCRGIHIGIEPDKSTKLQEDWERFVGDEVPLVILESPYRSLTGPLVAYIDEVCRERHHMVTVILPEFVSDRWWHSLLHNNSALMIKLALLNRPGVVVSNVRYFLRDEEMRTMFNLDGENGNHDDSGREQSPAGGSAVHEQKAAP
jgi:amino acid transporter